MTVMICGVAASARAQVTEPMRALDLDGRVVLVWKMEPEAEVLGFHVWRQVDGMQTRLTPTLIAGSAFVGPALPSVRTNYAWEDTDAPAGSHYWIEELRLDGETRQYGPLFPVVVSSVDGERDFRRSRLVSEISAPQNGYRDLGAVSIPSGSTLTTHGKPSRYSTLQFDIASQEAVKIGVRETGWYRIDRTTLVAAGLDPYASPKDFHLYADGVRVPLIVHGEQDGSFDAGDWIGFYGEGLDTPSTDTRVYWLVTARRGGTTIGESRISRATPNPLASFPYTVERKDRVLFFAALNNGDADSFFGPVVNGQVTIQTLGVSYLDTNSLDSAKLGVKLQGVVDSPWSTEDHRVQVSVNGVPVGQLVFDGRSSATTLLDVPLSALRNGSNDVSLVALGGSQDVSVVDTVRLTYPRLYVADNDRLRFSAPGLSSVKVRGFSTPDITVVDVTDPAAPEMVHATVTLEGDLWSVTISTSRGSDKVLIASTTAKTSKPAYVVANKPSRLFDKSNAADLIILTADSLRDAAMPLVEQRETEGYRVVVADIVDVFDEFGFGSKDSASVRSFLDYAASNWSTSPRFLLLLGDASVDPRGYLGMNAEDLVPTKLVMTQFIKTASDDWLSDFDDDGIANIATGRIPARNVTEARTMIAKTLAYDTASDADGWSRRVLMVAGPNDDGNRFQWESKQVEPILPTDVEIRTAYAGEIGSAAARETMLSTWNSGALVVNYFGHGLVAGWNLPYLGTGDARQLANGSRQPLVIALTCLTGFFHDPSNESIGEALIRNGQGGAVAVWGSSTLTFLNNQRPAGQAAYRLLFNNDLTIGEVMIQAKAATADQDVRKSWILLGDPTLRLRY